MSGDTGAGEDEDSRLLTSDEGSKGSIINLGDSGSSSLTNRDGNIDDAGEATVEEEEEPVQTGEVSGEKIELASTGV